MQHRATSDLPSKVLSAIRIKNYIVANTLLKLHIQAHPEDFVAYDIKCLCALHCGDYGGALADAVACTGLAPTWARGWARLGAAQLCLGHVQAAESAYKKGLSLDPGNEELIAGLSLAQRGLKVRRNTARRQATVHSHQGD